MGCNCFFRLAWRASLAVLFLWTIPSYAANHFVAASTSTVDCGSLNGGVKPGDTITLSAGDRGPLTIRNCQGTEASPILVQNDPAGRGPTVIRRDSASSGGFVFICRDCVYVVIDGTGGWDGMPNGAYCGAPSGRNGCGIKVTSLSSNDSPSAFLKLNRHSTKMTVRGLEIDGRRSDLNTWGIGISQNDHSILAADYPDFWREDFVYEQNFIHNVHGEGMYLGANWREPDLHAPLRNITIRRNLVEDTGRQSIQLKSALGGTNRIHHNIVRRSGLRSEEGQGAGISVFEGGQNVMIYNNWVEASGVQGIQHYNRNIPATAGEFSSKIYNNVVFDSGRLRGTEGSGHCITVSKADGSASVTSEIFNNTIVKCAHNGINFGSRVQGGVARDNLVSDTGSAALSLSGNANENNRVSDVAGMKFLNPGELNFRLTAGSPARDAGARAGAPGDDFVGVPRPQGASPDQGAFEFSTTEAEPESPESLRVQ